MSELPFAGTRGTTRATATDPKHFVAKVKVYAVASTVAAFGIIWGFVASNAVGVTTRETALGTTADPTAEQAPEEAPGRDFFAGGAGEAPTFVDEGAPAGGGQLPTVDGWGGLGQSGNGSSGRGSVGPVIQSAGS